MPRVAVAYFPVMLPGASLGVHIQGDCASLFERDILQNLVLIVYNQCITSK